MDKDRGKDYLHSTYIDLIINGLVGIRPAFGPWLAIAPLADETIDYFALDNVLVHGRNITVAFDKAGKRYASRGCTAGMSMCVWLDGKLVAHSPTLAKHNISLV